MALKIKRSTIKPPKVARLKKPRAEASSKRKGFRASKGTRFVLLVGDEGAILVHIDGNVVRSRHFVPDSGKASLDELAAVMEADVNAPLMMVVDSMDQTYVQHTLPPVSKLSVNKLIKTRLDRDFGRDAIKGSVLLGREENGRKDWNFLMISLERSPHMAVWLDFAEAVPNRFYGIYLVSVETEVLIKNLERAMALPKEETSAQWKFFVSHNKVGGFRQVILRNGRIVFTRLAQPMAETNPEVVAGNIEQEITTTLEYVRRLSFKPEDGLDVYVIAAGGIKPFIDGAKFEARGCHVMTPFEVAQHLGIEGATQPTDQFGDVILAASIGCSKQHVLKLTTVQTRKLDSYFQILSTQKIAAALIALLIILYAGYEAFSMFSVSQDISALEETKQSQTQAKSRLEQDIKNSNLDVDKVSDLIDLYQMLQKERLSPMPLVHAVLTLKQLPVTIKSIDWVLGDGTPIKAESPPTPPGAKVKMGVTLNLIFVSKTSDPTELRDMLNKVLNAYKDVFKGYDVSYGNIPAELKDDAKLEISFNPTGNAAPQGKTLDIQMVIKGDMLPDFAVLSAKGAPK